MRNKILIVILVISTVLVGFIFAFDRVYKSNLDVKIDKEYKITIEEGATVNSVIDQLDNDGVIKSKFMTKFFLKSNPELSAVMIGDYTFDKKATLKSLWTDFSKGQQAKMISFQIIEGESITKYAKVLAQALGDESRSEEILNFWNSEEYVRSTVDKYECVGEEVLNPEIFYPLEGYLKPDTYFFGEHDFTFDNLEFITNVLLDAREDDYNNYVNQYGYNDYTTNFHEVITLASIIDREATTLEDRKIVAGIFMNRIENGDSLGSDITTYYAEQVPIHERDLYQNELDELNAYNTRGPLKGLPVGPVNNPSAASIEAVLDYTENDYYYFVSDKNGKMYYTKTFSEHQALVTKLKSEDLWYEWN